MDAIAVLTEALSRPVEVAHTLVDGADATTLNRQVEGVGNSITWLVWHTGREIDTQIAPLKGTDQVWTREGWADKLALPFPPSAMGYGQTTDEVARVTVQDPALLTGYLDAVAADAYAYLATLSDADLDRVIDENWDPPVTLGVRLISIVDDAAQHMGQAAYANGLPG